MEPLDTQLGLREHLAEAGVADPDRVVELVADWLAGQAAGSSGVWRTTWATLARDLRDVDQRAVVEPNRLFLHVPRGAVRPHHGVPAQEQALPVVLEGAADPGIHPGRAARAPPEVVGDHGAVDDGATAATP